MRASELMAKKVINITDGSTIGTVIDYDYDNDKITSLILEQQPKRFFLRFSKGDHELIVPYKNIVTIGDDVILVKYGTNKDFVLK